MFQRSLIFTTVACALILIAPGCDKSESLAVKPTFTVDDLPAFDRPYKTTCGIAGLRGVLVGTIPVKNCALLIIISGLYLILIKMTKKTPKGHCLIFSNVIGLMRSSAMIRP